MAKKPDPQPSPELIAPAFRILLLFVPVALAVFLGQLKTALLEPAVSDWVEKIPLQAMDDATSGTLSLQDGPWRPVRNGYSPATLKGATVEVNVPEGPWDSAEIRVSAAPESRWSIRMSRSYFTERGPQVESKLLPNVLDNETVYELPSDDIPGSVISSAPIRLKLIAEDPGRAADGEFALLRQVNVRFSAKQLDPLPHLPDIIALGLLPFLGAIFLRLYMGWTVKRSANGGLALGVVFCLIALYMKNSQGGTWAVATGLAAATALHALFAMAGMKPLRRSLSFDRGKLERAALWMGLAAIMLAGLAARWDAFEVNRRSELSPDAAGYIEIASAGGALYETAQEHAPWVREPLFPWLLRAWFVCAPETAASARFFSMLISLAALAAVFLVGVRLMGWVPGIVAALAVAVLPEWADIASKVLRIDLVVLLTMGAFANRLWLEDRPWWRSASWAIVGTAMVLTRISALSFIVPIIAWEAIRKRWNWGEVFIPVLLLIVLLAPHLRFNQRHSPDGDLFYSSTVHTRFYLNAEHIGEPGWPTAEEYRANPYSGDPVTSLGYFFKFHTLPEVIVGHVKGYWNLFVWRHPRVSMFFGWEWLMIPGLVGAWAMLRDRKWWAAIWFGIIGFPFAFIARNWVTWRLGAEIMIFDAWVWALGVQAIVLYLWALRKGKARDSEPEKS
ncbi:glycosyltransferase family 39 protein [bacterium]|nr:glycosyltransferase family 39 protein [bacterium]